MASDSASLGDLFTKCTEYNCADILAQDVLSRDYPAVYSGGNTVRITVDSDRSVPVERLLIDRAAVYDVSGKSPERITDKTAQDVLSQSTIFTIALKRDKSDRAYRGGNSVPVTCKITCNRGGKGMNAAVLCYGSINIAGAMRGLSGLAGTRSARGDDFDSLV